MKEEWLMPGAVVPVDVETTAALVSKIHRLIGIVNAIKQRPWVGLTDEEWEMTHWSPDFRAGAKWAEEKLKEKNNG